jgi:hypothetical protein
MAEKKLTIHRNKAFALLAGTPLRKSMNVEEVAQYIHSRYHPSIPLEIVRKKYFPIKGPTVISSLEGKPRQEILERMKIVNANVRKTTQNLRKLNQTTENSARRKRMNQTAEFKTARRESMLQMYQTPLGATRAEKAAETVRNWWKDTEFVKANSERASERMLKLHQDPEFSKARNKRLQKLRQDPTFLAENLAAIQRRWETYRRLKQAELKLRTGWENKALVPVTEANEVENQVIRNLKHEELLKALRELTPAQKAAIYDVFELDIPNNEGAGSLSDEEKTTALNQALAKLRKNNRLKQLLS